MIVIAKAIIGIVIVCIGLYALSTLPQGKGSDKGIDYKALFAWTKKNIFKVLTVGLILYCLYLNILYANVKKHSQRFYDEYYETRHELDSLSKVNNQLVKEIDSLKTSQTRRTP